MRTGKRVVNDGERNSGVTPATNAREPEEGAMNQVRILNSMRGFKNAAKTYDLPVAARFVKFAKLFPRPFKQVEVEARDRF